MANMSSATSGMISDVQRRLEKLVEAARDEGREQALAEVRSLVGGGFGAASAPRPVTRDATAVKQKAPSTTKSGKQRKNPWAGLSDADRLARVNAIRRGRGLPLKTKL
jgi:hypothetical protein